MATKVFISWSGQRSKLIAEAVKDPPPAFLTFDQVPIGLSTPDAIRPYPFAPAFTSDLEPAFLPLAVPDESVCRCGL